MKANGFKYYEMVLCYVDDVLSKSHNPMRTMKGIQQTFKLKDDKIEEPKDYLGAGLSKMIMDDRTEYWMMASDKYIRAAVTNVEARLSKEGKRLPSKCGTPLQSGYMS